MFDAEDEEFNDIIDEQGALVGEKFLTSEFAATGEEAQQQKQTIESLIEKDTKSRNRNLPANANPTSAGTA